MRNLVICGPPGSGKTYLAKRKQRSNTIVFDMDAIAAALNPGFEDYENRPQDVARMILDLRESIVRNASTRALRQYRVIIICCDQRQANRIATQIKGEVIKLEQR